MGKQSSRLYYQGKDHKDIYFQGHYHDAMYVGSQLVWEKLDETITRFLSSDINPDETSAFIYGVSMTNNGTLYVREMTITGSSYNVGYFVTPDGEIIQSAYTPERYGGFSDVGGLGYSFFNYGIIILPDVDIWKTEISQPPTESSTSKAVYVNGMIIVKELVIGKPDTKYYNVNSMELVHEDYLEYSDAQWFNGALYAKITNDQYEDEYCYTTDGFNWFPSNKIQGTGVIINNILFLKNGLAFDENLNAVGYTRTPQFFYNGYYYSKEYNDSYIYRSKDLTNWEAYKEFNYVVTLCGYWKQKRWLIAKEKENTYWKCKMNL